MTESPQLSASLLKLKLLDALRGGDTDKIDSVINELSSCKSTLQTQDIIQLKQTVLHYAVQVASLTTIQYLVNNADKLSLDINAQDTQGNTPLHLAAASGRLDVVKYLLSLPNINDTIVNLDKKQPVEVSKDANIAQVMQFERAKFVEKAATDLRQYFSNRDFDNLEKLLVLNPRASELLDINGAEPQTGNTVLHEFIKKDDLAMCDWILKHGGDPFKRDKHGKLPIDLVNSKNDPLKKLIKLASKDQTIMDPVASTNNAIKTGNAPVYKGYLRKWTNFASGYKLRYFMLDLNGILSYYTNQDDTNNSCRGSLNLRYATLHLDSSEKLKFEIYGKNGLRWHLKANHPIETNRWVWTLQNAITIAKDNIKKRNRAAAQKGGAGGGPQAPSSTSPVSPTNDTSAELPDENDAVVVEKKRHRLRIPGKKRHKRSVSQSSTESAEESSGDLSRSSTFKSNLKEINEGSTLTGIEAHHPQLPVSSTRHRFSTEEQPSGFQEQDHENFDLELEDYDAGDYDSEAESSIDLTQLDDQIATTRRSLQVELASLLELFEKFTAADPNSKEAEVCVVGGNTIRAIHELVLKYNTGVDVRYAKLKKNLDRQLEVNALWENSIHQLEKQIAERESKLAQLQDQRKQLKKYFSNVGTTGNKTGGTMSPVPSQRMTINEGEQQEATIQLSPEQVLAQNPDDKQIGEVDEKLNQARNKAHGLRENEEPPHIPGALPEEVLEQILGEESDDDDEFFDADEFDEDEGEVPPPQVQDIEREPELPKQEILDDKSTTTNTATATQDGVSPATKAAGAAGIGGIAAALGAAHVEANKGAAEQQQPPPPQEQPEPVLDGKQPEVKGADDVGPLDTATDQETAVEEEPKKVEEDEGPVDESLNPAQREVNKLLYKEGSYLGYENPPRKKLALDEDNRPKVGLWGILKSMIGKDMTKMTLPVSFNEPTSLLQRLTEDIEYNNLLNTACQYDDSTLRLVYVAAFAASEYSSTIDRIAKPFNPLLGETFEYARPDGNYRILVEQVSHHPPISACSAESPKWDYYGENAVDSKFYGRSFDFKHLGKMFCVLRPDNGVKNKKGELVSEELYSWKKVNTAVVGIMLGNPTVDNYGKMVVENHTTGDVITVDLKQRGWRASSAYQLSGHALDKNGVAKWAMGGHWNSKIFAKKVTKDQQADGHAGERKMSLLDDPAIKSGAPSSNTSKDPYSGGKFLVWQVAPRPKVPFNLTGFALTLNGIDDKLKPWLAPTDTRLRPDQRDMEDGLYDRAADEKHRVEVKQRQARKRREDNNEKYVPNWFVKKKHPVTGDMFWEYNGTYWPRRKVQDLADTGDIF
ncbi:Oxysterol-binding 1 [Candida viswanathii]|uniref:Oxysterol-binding 1 n=1 Tax=Candida viswanathii TaxID=5486 RepID=A0A367YDG3_9ASCO|nr:Oxysterol-binding 1 [Candida viswanathii]